MFGFLKMLSKLDSVKMLACMLGACKIGLQWSIWNIHRKVELCWILLKKMLACMFGGM